MIVVANGKYSLERQRAGMTVKNLALARELADWLDRLYPAYCGGLRGIPPP